MHGGRDLEILVAPEAQDLLQLSSLQQLSDHVVGVVGHGVLSLPLLDPSWGYLHDMLSLADQACSEQIILSDCYHYC